MSEVLQPQLLLLALIVLFSHTVQAMTGFGSTVIALTLGALFWPITELRLVLIALNLPLSLLIVLRQPGAIDQRLLLRRMLPWMGLGVLGGLLLGSQLGGTVLKRLFGALVLAFALRELWSMARSEARAQAGDAQTSAWLVAAGFVHGIYASGGPLVVTALSGVRLNRRVFRATLMALWFVLSAVLLVTALLQGQWSAATTRETLVLLPMLPLGAFLGEWLHHRVSDVAFGAVIQLVLVVAGAALLL